MKRFYMVKYCIMSLIILSGLLALSACSNGKALQQSNLEQTSMDQYIAGETASDDHIVNSAKQEGYIPAYGSIKEDTVYFLEENLRDLAELSRQEIISLPVYRDLYPYGHGGIEVKVTDDLILRSESNLIAFLQLAGRYDESTKLIPADYLLENAIFACDIGKEFFVSGPNSISVRTEIGIISDILSDVDFLKHMEENALFSAACEYLDIKKPAIQKEIRPGSYGSSYEILYTIFEEEESHLSSVYNRSFNHVQVLWDVGDSDALICAVSIDTSEKKENYTLISYEKALDTALDSMENIASKKSVLAYEIVYTNEILHGYYIPCYKFYFEHSSQSVAGGLAQCTPVIVPAVDF